MSTTTEDVHCMGDNGCECIHSFNGVLDSCDEKCASCIIAELRYGRDVEKKRADTTESATVEAIAAWLADDMSESELALYLRRGDCWKKP